MATGELQFVDSHGHLHSEFPDEWVDVLVERMHSQNVRRSSLTGVGLLTDHEDTDVLRAYTKYPDLFFPFLCNFDPNDARSIDRVKHELNNGPWRGVGEIFLDTTNTAHANIPLRNGSVKKHPYPVPKDKTKSMVFRQIFDWCAEKKLLVFIHCERLKFLREVLRDHPETRFLAAHCDYRCSPQVVRSMLRNHPNVSCDFGPVLKHMRHKDQPDSDWARLHRAWRRLMKDFPDRLCLGTDIYSWPAMREDAYKKVYDAFRELLDDLPPEQARSIAGGNYQRLIGE